DQFKPDIVYHAAAYKHVPIMEINPRESVKTNVIGSKYLADISLDYNVEKFVMVSTDKAVRPTSVMGASKRFAEMYMRVLNEHAKTKFVITRFGNVLGSNGSVIPLFKKQIDDGGPVTVTHPEVTRYFMTIPESVQLVLEAGSMGEGGEIYLFDMGKSVRIIDLAKKMIKLCGLEVGTDIRIKIIGLRKGEKLYEELLTNEENTLKTHHPKIMIAQVSDYDKEQFEKCMSYLLDNIEYMNDSKIVSILKKYIPEYISQNSSYSELDFAKEKNERID
ncbi:MAG: polysaccharide biosynthesis protein, partial [Flavobacteriales bacterium]